jgi:hypothetical protein
VSRLFDVPLKVAIPIIGVELLAGVGFLGWLYLVERPRIRLDLVELEKNVELAKAHVPIIEKAIEADSRFKDVLVCYGKINHGGISICARLEKEAYLPDLKRLVDATRPPRPVEYSLFLPSDEKPEPGEARRWINAPRR